MCRTYGMFGETLKAAWHPVISSRSTINSLKTLLIDKDDNNAVMMLAFNPMKLPKASAMSYVQLCFSECEIYKNQQYILV